jgi:hypothetical protein
MTRLLIKIALLLGFFRLGMEKFIFLWYNSRDRSGTECEPMSATEIQKIIDETAFTMEVEGFILTTEEKDNIRKVLSGEIPFAEQLQIYIDKAKRIGGKANAEYQRV